MITAQEFRNKYIGKAIDVDGAYGAQCVDLFKQVCYLAGKKPFALGGSGYAEEIVKRYKPLGLDTYFNLVSLANAQYGDWIVWSKGSHDCPDSHVAMFIKKDGNSRVIVLGQNQFGKAVANEGSLSIHGIIGVLRLKAWSTTESTGTCKYGVGTKVCTNHIWSSSTDTGQGFTGDWQGTITSVIPNALHPYLIGSNTGWTDDASIDSDPHVPGQNGLNPSTNKIAQEAARFGLKIGNKETVKNGFYISEHATIYGGASYGVKVPESIKKATTYYTCGGVKYDHNEWWVLANHIMSWVKVSETLVK